MEDMRLILGNTYVEIKKLPDKSVDLIITDPPYDIDTKYTSCMRNDIGKSYHSVIKELSADDLTSGIEISILDDFLRVLKTINVYIWCNRRQIIPYLDFFVKEHGCTYDILVWIKTNPIPGCGRNHLTIKSIVCIFGNSHNYILHIKEVTHTGSYL